MAAIADAFLVSAGDESCSRTGDGFKKLTTSIQDFYRAEGSNEVVNSSWNFLLDIASKRWGKNPEVLFNTLTMVLLSLVFVLRINSGSTKTTSSTTQSTSRLQKKFLSVFWLLRMASWMSGPYVYTAYASKGFAGENPEATVGRIFLAGHLAVAVLGPFAGRLVDARGRKMAVLAAFIASILGELSVLSSTLSVLLVGRALGATAQVLSATAPEAWLIGETKRIFRKKEIEGETGDDVEDEVDEFLGGILELAYSVDPLVAIFAGQFAGWLVDSWAWGADAPFLVSPVIFAVAALIVIMGWEENKAEPSLGQKQADAGSFAAGAAKDQSSSFSLGDRLDNITEHDDMGSDGGTALTVMWSDRKILSIGCMQFLFETALAVFVIQWPPAIEGVVEEMFGDGKTDISTPYGAVFSTFMSGCLLGSTVFARLSAQRAEDDNVGASFERSTSTMLATAAASLALTSYCTSSTSFETDSGKACNALFLILSLVGFEVCAGMYFPSIGTLRGRYVPDSHLTAIVTLFEVPLNLTVMAVLSAPNMLGGVSGAMGISSLALVLAFLFTRRLESIRKRELDELAAAELAASRMAPKRRLRRSSIYTSSNREIIRGSRRESFRMDIPLQF